MKDGAVWQQLSVIASGEFHLWNMESLSIIFGNECFFYACMECTALYMRHFYGLRFKLTLSLSNWSFLSRVKQANKWSKKLLNSTITWSLLTHSHLCVIFPYMAHSRSWHLFLWVLPVWSRLEGRELQLFYSYRHLYVQSGAVVQRSWSVCVWELWMHSARGLRLHLRQMPHLPWRLYLEEVSVIPILSIK